MSPVGPEETGAPAGPREAGAPAARSRETGAPAPGSAAELHRGANDPAHRLLPADARRPLWDEVDSNKWKSFFLLSGCGVLVGALGYLFGEYTGMGAAAPLLALAIAGFMAWSSYYYSDRIVLAVSHARPVNREEHPHLVNAVEGLAIAAGLPTPRVYLIDDSAPNAFATGRNPRNAAIAVTTGLIDKLDRQELEGVIAHEMSHIKNYDIRMTTLAAVLVGSVALMSDWGLRSMRWGMWSGRARRGGKSGGGAIVAILVVLFAILAPIAAQILQFALSRRREYLADSNGALLTRYPEGLASALEKIAADTEPLEVANRATAPLYFVNPLFDYKGRRAGLFDTHPPIEERVRRLRSF